MKGLEVFLDLAKLQVGIAIGRGNVGMTEELLDDAKIGTVVDKMRGKGVA